MEGKQAYPSDTEDLTLEALRLAAQDADSELFLAWLDAMAQGERVRSSSTPQPQTNHGPKDAATKAARP
jgi:hypothetical protein